MKVEDSKDKTAREDGNSMVMTPSILDIKEAGNTKRNLEGLSAQHYPNYQHKYSTIQTEEEGTSMAMATRVLSVVLGKGHCLPGQRFIKKIV